MIEQTAEPLDDCKAQTETRAAVAFPRSNLVELAENIRSLILGNADTAVPDFDAQLPAETAAADNDSAAARVTNRVGNEIEQYPLKQNKIAAHPCAARHDSQLQSP